MPQSASSGAQPNRASAAGGSSAEALFERATQTVHTIAGNMERAIHGKREIVDLLLLTVLAEGHLLIEDVPGVGKTLLAKSFAISVAAATRRVQFTPDLLPTDISGVNIWNPSTGAFEFRRGPVFCHILLCDEVNRAPAKTQSALLEAMEERHVSIDGATYRLPRPFLVIATQNPFEHSGTYTLPDSQLDRFLIRSSVGYPAKSSAMAMLDDDGSETTLASLAPVATLEDLRSAIAVTSRIHVAAPIKEYVLELVEATRHHPRIRLGASPRGAVALLRAARARALQARRTYVLPDDVAALATPVLAHRVQLAGARESDRQEAERIIGEIVSKVAAPSNPAKSR